MAALVVVVVPCSLVAGQQGPHWGCSGLAGVNGCGVGLGGPGCDRLDLAASE